MNLPPAGVATPHGSEIQRGRLHHQGQGSHHRQHFLGHRLVDRHHADRIAALVDDTPDCAQDVSMMLDFLAQVSPQRGIVR